MIEEAKLECKDGCDIAVQICMPGIWFIGCIGCIGGIRCIGGIGGIGQVILRTPILLLNSESPSHN